MPTIAAKFAEFSSPVIVGPLSQVARAPGRPKGLIGDALYQYLISNGCRTLKEMVAGAVQAAIEGNPKALAVIRDSVDGRPPLAIDLDATVNASVSVSLAERLERARRRALKALQEPKDGDAMPAKKPREGSFPP
jgi:hypothetical protein